MNVYFPRNLEPPPPLILPFPIHFPLSQFVHMNSVADRLIGVRERQLWWGGGWGRGGARPKSFNWRKLYSHERTPAEYSYGSSWLLGAQQQHRNPEQFQTPEFAAVDSRLTDYTMKSDGVLRRRLYAGHGVIKDYIMMYYYTYYPISNIWK